MVKHIPVQEDTHKKIMLLKLQTKAKSADCVVKQLITKGELHTPKGVDASNNHNEKEVLTT